MIGMEENGEHLVVSLGVFNGADADDAWESEYAPPIFRPKPLRSGAFEEVARPLITLAHLQRLASEGGWNPDEVVIAYPDCGHHAIEVFAVR